jgi:hypothetical protein
MAFHRERHSVCHTHSSTLRLSLETSRWQVYQLGATGGNSVQARRPKNESRQYPALLFHLNVATCKSTLLHQPHCCQSRYGSASTTRRKISGPPHSGPLCCNIKRKILVPCISPTHFILIAPKSQICGAPTRHWGAAFMFTNPHKMKTSNKQM